jgi:hypothetical protein
MQDYDHQPQMCAVKMFTDKGGNCKAWVTCNDGQRDYLDWNVCYVNGRQYFTDPRIGDFSITFTDGSDGLATPILQVSDVANWAPYDVDAMVVRALKYPDENHICIDDNPYPGLHDTSLRWVCGVPKVGAQGNGFKSNGPVNAAGYRPGWCGVHVTQHQKQNPATDKYKFDIKIFDANNNVIGSVDGADATNPVIVDSKLPNTLVVTAGNVDADAVLMDYAGQHWGSNDQAHHCNFGAYDSGKREGDCGFTCD